MKCEPLSNKKQKMKNDIHASKDNSKEKTEFYTGYEKGVDDAFAEFASYFDLYKRYKNDLKLLMNEQKHVWVQWVKYYETQKDINNSNYLNRYNEWLFEYIFSYVNSTKPADFLTI